MLEFISENFILIIAVIVILVVNVVRAGKKQAKSESSADDPNYQGEEVQPVPKEEPAALGHWETEKPVPRTPAAPPAAAASVFSQEHETPAVLPSARTAEPGGRLKNPPPAGTAAQSPAGVQPAAGSFYKKLDSMPSFKKAVVLSEILSPPKALRSE